MKYLPLFMLVAACSGKQSPAPEVPEVSSETEQAYTCDDLGARTAKDIADTLATGVPADVPGRFGALVAELCERDAWPQAVIDCGMTAENPREQCSPQLSEEQRAHIDEAQLAFGHQLMVEMAAGDMRDLLEPLGDADCDGFRAAVERLSRCEPARAAMGEESVQQMIVAARGIPAMYAQERDDAILLCRQSLGFVAGALDEHGCGD